MKKTRIISFIGLLFIVSGCRKEGPAGQAGEDGNANVKSSTITFSGWIWQSSNAWSQADFTWPVLTSSIVNSGAMYVYLNTAYGWAQLPRVIYPTSSYSQTQRFYYNVNSFTIIVQDSDLLQPSPALGTWTIKVVAVDASIRLANPDLDWSNYEAVRARLQLKDNTVIIPHQ